MNRKKKTRRKTSSQVSFMSRVLKTGSAKLGFALMIGIVALCLFGPMLSPWGVNEMDVTNMYASPSAKHWLGCDAVGRDIFTRLMYGGRFSLLLGISATLLSSITGVILGTVGGYFGGKTETIIMRFMDIWSALPGMLLCILISSFMGSGFLPTIIALTVGSIPGGVRMTRGQVLAERSKEYIEAAESFNCPKWSIMFRHLLPNVVQPMIIITTMNIGSVITMAASLSYIGLGIQPPTPEWGAMLADGKAYIMTYPHLITSPGVCIALTVLALNLLGDGIRDALDPKLRG